MTAPPPRIRAVLVDFGGVLYRPPDPQRLQRFLRLLGIRDLGLLEIMYRSPTESAWVMDLMTGATREQSAWEALAQSWGVRPSLLRFFRRGGYARRRWNTPLAAYISGLRPRCRTAVLTNAGSDFRATFSRSYRLESLVDQVIISAEEGLAKPDPAIFRLAAERLDVSPAEALMIDDLAENIEGAQSAGMRALLFDDTASVITRIDEILNPPQ